MPPAAGERLALQRTLPAEKLTGSRVSVRYAASRFG